MTGIFSTAAATAAQNVSEVEGERWVAIILALFARVKPF